MDSASAPREFEILDVRLVARRLDARPLDARPAVVPAGPARRTRHVFFDTKSRRILRAGFALRVTGRGRKSSAELIRLGHGAAGDAFREDVKSARAVDVADAPGAVGSRVRLLVGASPLHELAELRVRSSRHALRDGDEELGSLVLEDVAVPLGPSGRHARIQRVRVETAPGQDPSRLDAFVAELRAACGLRDAASTSTEAAFAARGVSPPAPPQFGPTTIDASSTLGETAFAVMRRQFAAFLENESGTRLGDDPEELHDMRVASRRLRAATSLFRAALPKRAKSLREELAWVAAALGEVRDLDVQNERFAAWVADDARLAAAAAAPERRDAARRKMMEVLDSPRYRRFVREFGAMLRKGPARGNDDAASPVVAAAPDLVRGRRRKVKKAAKGLAPDSPAAAYHALRIRCKRLRYALEFLSDVYGPAATALARRIAEVQEILGRHQDAHVAIERVEAALAQDPAPPPATAFALGIVAERCAQESAQLRAAFPRAYARTTGKPWRRLRAAMERLRPVVVEPPAATAGDETAIHHRDTETQRTAENP